MTNFEHAVSTGADMAGRVCIDLHHFQEGDRFLSAFGSQDPVTLEQVLPAGGTVTYMVAGHLAWLGLDYAIVEADADGNPVRV